MGCATMSEDSREEVRPGYDWFNSFWLVATPKLFEWFGWVVALGASQYVYEKTRSNVVLVLLLVGYSAMLLYSHTTMLRWVNISAIKAKHHREALSGLIAVAITGLAGYVAQEAISAFSKSAL